MLTDAWRDHLRDGIDGSTSTDYSKVTHLAVGNSTAAASSTFTQLGNETGRMPVTSYSTQATGKILVRTYVGPPDLNVGTIREIGWFAGPAASTSANTGVLVKRVRVNKTKDSGRSFQEDLTYSYVVST